MKWKKAFRLDGKSLWNVAETVKRLNADLQRQSRRRRRDTSRVRSVPPVDCLCDSPGGGALDCLAETVESPWAP